MAAERRLAAIVYTDIVGYTSLSQQDEGAALRLVQEQERLAQALLPIHHGRKVKSIGDGLLLEFPDALEAVEFSIDLQRHLYDRNARTRTQTLQVRIGIHLGDVEGFGRDILGDSVNVASRIYPLAEPGGVCLSEPVCSQVRKKVAYQFERLGPETLKGVLETVDVYRVVLPWAEEVAAPREAALPRIAVIPLTNMSPDPADEYFADGLTEELISTISKVRDINVISRTSVMQYKAHPKRVAEIGRELGVGTILEGSVRKAGNKVRITVQLIDSASDKHLWAESYDRDLEDIFSIQTEIADKVAGSLRTHLLGEQRVNDLRIGTKDSEAYTLLLKGRFYLHRWDELSVRTGISYFEQAIAADPRYAAAYAALAGAYQQLLTLEAIDSTEGNRRIEECAQQALLFDGETAEARVMAAVVLTNRYDWDAAEIEVRKALDLDPNLASAHINLAVLLGVRGNLSGCLVEIDQALRLDPASVGAIQLAGTFHLYARDYEQAIRLLQHALELDRMDFRALHNLGLAHIQVGQLEEGLEELTRAATSSGPRRQDACLAYAYCKAGKTEEASRLLDELLHPVHGERIPAVAVAGIYNVLGETDRAVEWLERAFTERARQLMYITWDFVFDDLRDDPRFRSLLRRMNLA